jgi:Ca2+-binding EF-hand superfamily protein
MLLSDSAVGTFPLVTDMHQPLIDVFDYEEETRILPEAWMKDMATVFREFDEDEDGKIQSGVGRHIMALFRLPHKNLWKDLTVVSMSQLLNEAAIARNGIFSNPYRRYVYYFQQIAGIGRSKLDAVDIQRFIRVSGDEIPLKFCDDFIDEFDRATLSKDALTLEEFCNFCSARKVPV